MDFPARLTSLSQKIGQVSDSLGTEEATKTALVMPFLHSVLGYDVFDPSEVIPEFTADIGTKKGEKVDYALVKDGEVRVLVECKKYGEKLTSKHTGQLFRYFSVSDARLAILTNGSEYEFYTDLDAPNKMDEKPFLTLDLADIDDRVVPEIRKFTKTSFDVDSVVDAAGELKYLSQIRKILEQQLSAPDEDFVQFFSSRVQAGSQTAAVRSRLPDLITKALKQFLNDSSTDRLKSASGPEVRAAACADVPVQGTSAAPTLEIDSGSDPKVVATDEELEGLGIVKAILEQKLDVSRIKGVDRERYFVIFLDDNIRQPLCRLRFKGGTKKLDIRDSGKWEKRHPIESVKDIFGFEDQLLATASHYE